MGCGNSSQTNNRSSSSGGRVEFSSKPSDESLPDDDDERRKNYGGVYVGLPLDLSNVPQVQIGSLRGHEILGQRNHTEFTHVHTFIGCRTSDS